MLSTQNYRWPQNHTNCCVKLCIVLRYEHEITRSVPCKVVIRTLLRYPDILNSVTVGANNPPMLFRYLHYESHTLLLCKDLRGKMWTVTDMCVCSFLRHISIGYSVPRSCCSCKIMKQITIITIWQKRNCETKA